MQHISSGVVAVNSKSTSPPPLWSLRGVDTAHLQRSGLNQLRVNFWPCPSWSWHGADTAHLQRSGPCQLRVNFSPAPLWSWHGVDTAHLQRSGPCQLRVNFSQLGFAPNRVHIGDWIEVYYWASNSQNRYADRSRLIVQLHISNCISKNIRIQYKSNNMVKMEYAKLEFIQLKE